MVEATELTRNDFIPQPTLQEIDSLLEKISSQTPGARLLTEIFAQKVDQTSVVSGTDRIIYALGGRMLDNASGYMSLKGCFVSGQSIHLEISHDMPANRSEDRSKLFVDVNPIIQLFGGAGHRNRITLNSVPEGQSSMALPSLSIEFYPERWDMHGRFDMWLLKELVPELINHVENFIL
ncbi:hypothetical protein HY389_02645 [Candidatus Daviesbacteria bacterium]|nr:hypothetical protein [Candidatus Daviesbacteria bacterium]